LNEYGFEQDIKYKFYENFQYYFKEFSNFVDEANKLITKFSDMRKYNFEK